MSVEDRIILNKKNMIESINRMFADLKQDASMARAFIQNPFSFLVKYKVINEENIEGINKQSLISNGNRLLFLILSNPELMTWIRQYQTKLSREFGDQVDLAKIDRKTIVKEFTEALVKHMDPDMFRAILESQKSPGVSAPRDIDIDISPEEGDVVVYTDVVIASDIIIAVEALSVVLLVVIVAATTGGVPKGFESINRRDFSVLLDSLAQELEGQASTYRGRIKHIRDITGQPF